MLLNEKINKSDFLEIELTSPDSVVAFHLEKLFTLLCMSLVLLFMLVLLFLLLLLLLLLTTSHDLESINDLLQAGFYFWLHR